MREMRPRDVSSPEVDTLSSTADTGVTKNKAGVLEMDLSRIEPDFDQPHRILPSKLHDRLEEGMMSCQAIMEQLLRRRENDDRVWLIA